MLLFVSLFEEISASFWLLSLDLEQCTYIYTWAVEGMKIHNPIASHNTKIINHLFGNNNAAANAQWS